ncbi:hypothetical protein LAB1_44340 [Roseibium sp. LAB1]
MRNSITLNQLKQRTLASPLNMLPDGASDTGSEGQSNTCNLIGFSKQNTQTRTLCRFPGLQISQVNSPVRQTRPFWGYVTSAHFCQTQPAKGNLRLAVTQTKQ